MVMSCCKGLKAADKEVQAKQKDDAALIQGALKQALSKANNELEADGEACGQVHVALLHPPSRDSLNRGNTTSCPAPSCRNMEQLRWSVYRRESF
jgi:hypothetical protein